MASPLKRAAQAVFHHAGGIQVARWVNRKGLRILMYHRFAGEDGLEAQCAHIRENYNPISMTDVAAWLQGAAPLPENPIAITVDDGYGDFFETAYPLFREYEIPATVFLVSDFLDGRLWLWVDQVRYAFQHTAMTRVDLEIPGGEALALDLSTAEARLQAARRVTEAAKTWSNAGRLAWMECLPAQLGVKIPATPPAEYAPLTWDQVRTMAPHGIEFGAHTRTHPILARLSSESELLGEIRDSRHRIEEQLDGPVAHFCYPNGSQRDINPETIEAVRISGFRTAVTTETGLNYPADDRLMLRRIGVEPGLSETYFHQCAAAFRV